MLQGYQLYNRDFEKNPLIKYCRAGTIETPRFFKKRFIFDVSFKNLLHE